MSEVNPEIVEEALSIIKTAADYEYFFDKLSSPAWIRRLAQKGMFDSPPEPVEVEGGGVQLPMWPQSRYLARMASLDPQTVREVIRKIPKTTNTRVLDDLADAFVAMPPEVSQDFVSWTVGWLGKPFTLLLPEKLSRLIRRWAEAGLTEPALRLARALFVLVPDQIPRNDVAELFPREAVPRFDAYRYEEALKVVQPTLSQAAGLEAVRVFANALATAIDISTRAEGESRRDYSFVWRRAIEDHEQNHLPGPRDALLVALRDAAVGVAGTSPKNLEAVLELLGSYDRSAFERIALHVLRVAARRRSKAVSERLIQINAGWDLDRHHEYWHLLRDRYPQLTAQQQIRVLRAIDAGPPSMQAESDEAKYLDDWKSRMYVAIEPHLPDAEAQFVQEQRELGRNLEHPDFHSYSSGGWVGPVSPIGTAEISALSVQDLVSYLADWEPSGEWNAPSRYGLGQAVNAAIAADLGTYVPELDRFTGLGIPYIYAVFSALRGAAANGSVFDWDPVLRLATWAVSQAGPNMKRDDRAGSIDVEWSSVATEVGRLLAIGFNKAATEIPFDLREKAWVVLEALSNDPQPDKTYESTNGSNMDPATLALNTVRPQALHTCVQYGLWVYRNLLGPAADTGEGHSDFGMMPELKRVLDRHLDRAIDPSLAVHSIYGQRYPWLHLLDGQWARGHRELIFPKDPSLRVYWDAAWSSYILYCPPYNDAFGSLRDEYLHAAAVAVGPEDGRSRPGQAGVHLVQHLAVMLLRGQLTETDPILERLFEHATPALRGQFLDSIGRNLRAVLAGTPKGEPLPLPTGTIDRLQALWTVRLEAARQCGVPGSFTEELSEVGWWLTSGVFDDEWILAQVTEVLRLCHQIDPAHHVMDRLSELAGRYPLEVLTIIDLMIEGDQDSWIILSGESSLRSALTTTLATSNLAVRAKAKAIVHSLGARGYRQFRDLLPGS